MEKDGLDVFEALEAAQRSERLRRPLPRRRLGPATLGLLWLLRIYVVAAVTIVVVTFMRAVAR